MRAGGCPSGVFASSTRECNTFAYKQTEALALLFPCLCILPAKEEQKTLAAFESPSDNRRNPDWKEPGLGGPSDLLGAMVYSRPALSEEDMIAYGSARFSHVHVGMVVEDRSKGVEDGGCDGVHALRGSESAPA